MDGTQALISRMVRRIPLVALENMSELKRIAEGLEPTSITVPVGSLETIPERGIFVEIKDKSMSNPREPISFEPGDKVMIDLDANPTPSDFVLALVPAEQTALFRLYREVGRAEDGTIIVDLVPLNPNFRTVRIADSAAGQILGVCRSIHRIFDLSSAGQRARFA